MLILAAIPFYLFACIAAANAARTVRQSDEPARDRYAWGSLAALFAFMIAVRLFDGENVLRDALRALLDVREIYQERRDFQGAAIALLCLAFAALAARVLRGRAAGQRGASRSLTIAKLAGLAYLGLFAARLISLHQIDALLYGGPHINRVIDPGLAALVGWMAIRFVRDRRRDLGGRDQRARARL